MPCAICYFHTGILDMKLNVRVSERASDEEREKGKRYDYNYKMFMLNGELVLGVKLKSLYGCVKENRCRFFNL